VNQPTKTPTRLTRAPCTDKDDHQKSEAPVGSGLLRHAIAGAPPHPDITLAARLYEGASVSASLARTLARPAKAVTGATMGASIALTAAAAEQRHPVSSPRRSLARVLDKVQVALERQPLCGMSAGCRHGTHRVSARRARASHGPASGSVSRRCRVLSKRLCPSELTLRGIDDTGSVLV
jgi:hypothetical protein